MELRDFLDVLRRRWLSATIVILTVLAATAVYNLVAPREYTATTRLFFAVQGTETVSELAQGSTFAEKQMISYAQVVTSPVVLDPVIDTLGLETSAADLARSISVTVPTDTVILQISVTTADPEQATQIANAVGTQIAETAPTLSSVRADDSDAVKATTLAPATVPLTPSQPNILRNFALGLALGLIAAVGVAVLRQMSDTKIRDEAGVRALTDAPILGNVQHAAEVMQHPLVLRDRPTSEPSEAVRRLRTNLQFINVAERPKSIVVTSAVPGEGKSTIALNLAVSLSDTGARVLLIDADLRRPSIADCVGIEGAAGLTTILIGRAELAEVVQRVGSTEFDVLTAGQLPPNPSELLGSSAMALLLAEATASYDMVILDSPPLLPVTDAAILSNLAAGALVVVGVDRTHRSQLTDALESLRTSGAHLFGLVINKVARRESGSYSYGHEYGTDQSAVVTDSITPKKPAQEASRPLQGALTRAASTSR